MVDLSTVLGTKGALIKKKTITEKFTIKFKQNTRNWIFSTEFHFYMPVLHFFWTFPSTIFKPLGYILYSVDIWRISQSVWIQLALLKRYLFNICIIISYSLRPTKESYNLWVQIFSDFVIFLFSVQKSAEG